MKTLRLLIALASLMIPCLLRAQSLLERTDFSTFRSQDKGDPISVGNEEKRRWQTDYYYRQLTTQRQNDAYLEYKIKKATQGITMSTDNSTVRTTSSRTQSSQRQQAQYQREREHQEWLNQRQAAIDAANEKRRLEEQRRQAEKIAKYNQAKENSLRMSNALHCAILR
mgnify:FL=1